MVDARDERLLSLHEEASMATASGPALTAPGADDAPVIHVHRLCKYYCVEQKQPGLLGSLRGLVRRTYRAVKAVEDISFDISAGELVGFLDPNGAGKTTTLKMLSGLLYPTGGQVSVLGYDPSYRQSEFQRQFSLVLGQKNQLWWDLPAIKSGGCRCGSGTSRSSSTRRRAHRARTMGVAW